MHSAGEGDGAGGSGHVLVDDGRESSVCKTGLSLELRGSRAVNTVAAAGISSNADPMLSLTRRASWDEREWSRRNGGSGGDGPVGKPVTCCKPEPLVAAVVEISSRLAKSRDSAIVGKERSSSREDVEWSIPVGLDVLASSRPHLKAITGSGGSMPGQVIGDGAGLGGGRWGAGAGGGEAECT